MRNVHQTPARVRADMIPGMGGGGRGMNPKRLEAMMRQMGIDMSEIDDVEEVIIRTRDKEIVIAPADVARIKQSGQVSWQITGTATERARGADAEPAGPTFTDEDVELVASQANVSKEKARAALEETDGQPAEAIIKLMGDE